MIRGENVVIKAGTEVTAFVDKDMQVATNLSSPQRTFKAASKPISAPRANAQEITLNDGQKFTGTVLGMNDGAYTISTSEGQYKIPVSSIQSIENSAM